MRIYDAKYHMKHTDDHDPGGAWLRVGKKLFEEQIASLTPGKRDFVARNTIKMLLSLNMISEAEEVERLVKQAEFNAIQQKVNAAL